MSQVKRAAEVPAQEEGFGREAVVTAVAQISMQHALSAGKVILAVIQHLRISMMSTISVLYLQHSNVYQTATTTSAT